MYEEQVKKGAAWLDEMSPGWYKAIDLGRLDLSAYDHCALGQTFGELACRNLCADSKFSLANGFMVDVMAVMEPRKNWWGKVTEFENKELTEKRRQEKFALLSGTWIKEILRRRKADRLMSDAVGATTAKAEE